MNKLDPTWIKMDADPMTARFRGIATHGNVPFDVPFISEIDENLFQGGCKDGLILPSNILHVVSLYPWESYQVDHEVISALAVYMYDSTTQGFEQINALAAWVNVCRKDGPTLVHCQAGLNRSSLVVARALMLWGQSADSAIRQIRSARTEACLCNRTFEAWLRNQDAEI